MTNAEKIIDSDVQVSRLKEFVQSYSDDCALGVIFARHSEQLALSLITNACANFAKTEGLRLDLADHVAQICLRNALDRCFSAKEKIRWAVLSLIRSKQPGIEIIAAAKRVNDKSDFIIPDTPLIEFLREMAQSELQRRSVKHR